MEHSETFTITLPPLLHILFYAGGLGILAALIGNAIHGRSARLALLAPLLRTAGLVVAVSALFSLAREGIDPLRMLTELGLFFMLVSIGFIYNRIILQSSQPFMDIFKEQHNAILLHVAYCLGVFVYFVLCTLALTFILGTLEIVPPQDSGVIAFMSTLNLFLVALFVLSYRRIHFDPERKKHHIADTLRVIVWPLMVALLLFILPLVMEKHVQSEEYQRSLNPPQRLHGI